MTLKRMNQKPEDRLLRLRQRFNIGNRLLKNCLCEFVCTAFLMYTGFCITAQTVLTRSQMNASIGLFIGWGLCLLFAVQMGYNISGAHLNPAVSLFAYSFGVLSFVHFLLYSLAQTLGAFVGALLTFMLYYEKINEFDGGRRAISGENGTAGIFATYPGEHMSFLGTVFDQICATAVLCFCINIVTDARHKIPRWAHPSLLGLMLMLVCFGYASNTGSAVNPARDLGPRLFTLMAGYGWGVFSYRNYTWFWIPIVCPLIGGLIGAWTYQFSIAFQIPDDEALDSASSTSGSQADLLKKELPPKQMQMGKAATLPARNPYIEA